MYQAGICFYMEKKEKMAGNEVEVLENRLSALEKSIISIENDDLSSGTAVESLLHVQNRIQAAITGREKITSVVKRLDDLEKYVDPEFQESLGLNDGAKLNLILSEENRIRQLIDGLQKVEDLKYVLDSEHIKAVPSKVGQLSNISILQTEQQEKVEKFSQEVQHQMSTYNNLINSLSKQFALWDKLVTEAEILAKPKEVLE